MWREELIAKPQMEHSKLDLTKKVIDHPLSNNKNSAWKKFYDDKIQWEEIEKDVKRTRVELAFFAMAINANKTSKEDFDRLEMQSHTKKSDLTHDDIMNYIESHSDGLARVLFIYASLNKGIKYVQGMNEVLAILYYCFWKYSSEAVISTQYFESDLFNCFSNLMSEIKDGFLRECDKEDSGVHGKCRAIEEIVKVCDPEVFEKL